MDILLLLMIAVILAPVLHVAGIVLGNSEIRSRGKKILKAQYMAKREPKKSLAPSVIPAEYTGKIELKDKQRDKDKKLQVLWQDAYDWFAIQNVAEVLAEAMRMREEYLEEIKPYEEDVADLQKEFDESDYFSSCTYEWLFKAKTILAKKQLKFQPYYTTEHEKVLELSDKYGWELIDNGIIRNVNKGKPLAVDPIVYAL